MYLYICNYLTQIHHQRYYLQLDPYDKDFAIEVYSYVSNFYDYFQLGQDSSLDQVVYFFFRQFHAYSLLFPYQVLDSVYALQLPVFTQSQMRKIFFVDFVGVRLFEFVLGAEIFANGLTDRWSPSGLSHQCS